LFRSLRVLAAARAVTDPAPRPFGLPLAASVRRSSSAMVWWRRSVAIIRGGGQSDDATDLHDAGAAGGNAVCRRGSSASAAATLRRQRGTGRSPRWADPVDNRVPDPARLCFSGVSMLGLATARREAARGAGPCNRDLLGAFRRPALRGRPFRHSGDTAAEWI